MSSHAQRAGRSPDFARLAHVERQLGRFHERVRPSVRALADRHPWLADLAVSFPALLFALALPRHGARTEPAIRAAIAGAALGEVARLAGLPTWTRRLPPEAFVRAIPPLPASELVHRRIANHLPRAKKAATWLETVADAAQWGHDAVAVWAARELTCKGVPKRIAGLQLISVFAWFSTNPDTRGHALIEQPWSPAMQVKAAREAAERWSSRVELELDLGDGPVADMWLDGGDSDGYHFVPLRSGSELIEEGRSMSNCAQNYGYAVAHNYSRLWSVRHQGERVATLEIGLRGHDPLVNILELCGPGNRKVPREISWAARRWLHQQNLMRVGTRRFRSGGAPLDRSSWIRLWRPYWLAKRRIPEWLPLRPSRRALKWL